MQGPNDSASTRTRVTVRKYSESATVEATRLLGGRAPFDDDFVSLGIDPYETVVVDPGNRLTTVGLAALTARLQTTAPVWSASSAGSGACGMGIGTGTTADAIGDTDIEGTKAFKQLDDTYPTRSNGAMTVKCTFTSAEANHAWENYGWIVPNTGASAMTGAAVTAKPANMILYNHKAPAALGTKPSGQTWSWQYDITIT